MTWKDRLKETSGVLKNNSGIAYRVIKIDEAERLIERLLGRQRKICADEFNKLFKKNSREPKNYPDAIRNASEPEGGE